MGYKMPLLGNIIQSTEMSFKLVIFATLCVAALAEEKYLDFSGSLQARKLDSRIVGGYDAQKGQFPHQVSLQFGMSKDGPMKHFCGGSILTREWVLTAGHCVIAVPPYGVFMIKAGKHNISRVEDDEQSSRVERIVMHKNYAGGIAPYDIALLKLQRPFNFTRSVQPISVPHPREEPTGQVTLSGWGSVSKTANFDMPDILQTVNLPLVDRVSCQNVFQKILNRKAPVHSTNICTGPLNVIGYAACRADSGGPLIQRAWNGQMKIVGVVSWGLFPCGNYGAPSVYVKVSDFVDWIQHVTAIR